MTHVVHATTPAELEPITVAIHDQVFDVDAIERDVSTTRIPFYIEDALAEDVVGRTRRGRAQKALIPLRNAALVVAQVERSELRDRSQIGLVHAVGLRFDANTREVVLEAAEEVEVVLTVEAIDVTLTITEEIVGRVQARYFWFGGEMRSGIEIFSR